MFWDVEVRERTLIATCEEMAAIRDVPISFGPIKTSLSALGVYGWKMYMRQSTPLHVAKTRPRIILHPSGSRDFGIRYRLRAREPFKSPDEIVNAIDGLIPVRFSMTKYETKTIPIVDQKLIDENAALREEIRLLRLNEKRIIEDETDIRPLKLEVEMLERELNRAMLSNQQMAETILQMQSDPFALLSQWNIETADRLWKETDRLRQPVDTTNVIDLIDHIRLRDIAEETELLERASRVMKEQDYG